MTPAVPTQQQAETVLGFIREVGLPWVLVFVLLAIIVGGLWVLFSKFLVEMRAIAIALTNVANANARLSDEVEEVRRATPVHGLPIVTTPIPKGGPEK